VTEHLRRMTQGQLKQLLKSEEDRMAKEAKLTELTTTDPELEALYKKFAGAGHSQYEEDRVQSFIKVLQQLSPELNSRESAYVEGAKAGDIWIATKSLLIPGQTGFRFQHCDYQKIWVEWPAGRSGGPVAKYGELPMEYRNIKTWGTIDLPNGHQIVETRYFMGLAYVDDMEPFPAIISYVSTGARVATNWLDRIDAKRNPDGSLAPAFKFLWHMVTKPQDNDRGQWYLLVPEARAEVQANKQQSLLAGEITQKIWDKKIQIGDEISTPQGKIDDQIPF